MRVAPVEASVLPILRVAPARRRLTRRLSDRDALFLVEATRILAESLDVETTLATVARLTLPHVGSWCLVDLYDHDRMRRLAVICSDPREQALAEQLLVGWPPERDTLLGAPAVMRTGHSVFTFPVSDEMLVSESRTPENLATLRALQIGSLMTVPLMAHGRSVGAITYVSPNHGDSFSEQDLELAEELASRCANAIGNSRLMQEAKEARAQAEDANLAKTRFLATMSHELRTPLNAIAGYSELLEIGLHGPLTAPQVSDVRRIQANGRHLLGLVESILSYAKLSAGMTVLGMENVGVAHVMREVEQIIAPLARAKGIGFRYLSPHSETDLAVRAQPIKLQQILINLAANAIKFTPHGGTIEIAQELVGEQVHIRVADNGIGIAAQFLERIFEPFVQLDDSLTRGSGGTGLGLAISRELVSAMGGALSVESALGKGSTFTVTLSRGR